MKDRSPTTEQAIAHAAGLLRAGRLVAFPTETVYGLGANALDPNAVARIFAAKGRPSSSPLIVHVSSIAMARGLVTVWPDAAEILTRQFWPGPLTLVVPKRPLIPDIVTAGLPTVGLRMPDHPVALALIRAAGVPLAAPSANRFTGLSPTSPEHVRSSLGAQVDFILEGGETDVGIESTVVSLAGPEPVLLRPGTVQRLDLEAWIGPVLDPPAAVADEAAAHPSPGMHRRHYSPRTPLLWTTAEATLPSGRGAYVWHSHLRAPIAHAVRLPFDAAGYARLLYRTLHDLDAGGWDWIAVEPPPDTPEWAAVRDRLRRAAAPDSTEPRA
jgi:L-threonylcarbamoyladenylate synthase